MPAKRVFSKKLAINLLENQAIYIKHARILLLELFIQQFDFRFISQMYLTSHGLIELVKFPDNR